MTIKTTLRDGSSLVTDGFNAVATVDGKSLKLDGALAVSHATGVIDADGAVFFQRQLEHIKASSYDVLYADLPARMLFPVSHEVNEGAETIVARSYDSAGQAQIVNNYADDIPRADVGGSERTISIRTIAAAYGYNTQEIKNAVFTGMDLSSRRMMAAARAMEERINNIAFFGDAEAGLTGLFSHSGIPSGDVADGAGGDTEFSTKTADEIITDINDLFSDMFKTTNMVEQADTLLLPPAQWSYISSTPRTTGTDTTILQYIVNNSPYLKGTDSIIPVNQCTAANNPTLSTDSMVAYNRNNRKLELEMPMEVQHEPVQMHNLEFVINMTARTAGLNVYYPMSLSIATGI